MSTTLTPVSAFDDPDELDKSAGILEGWGFPVHAAELRKRAAMLLAAR